MTMLKRIATLLMVAALASCGGGGGDAGTSVFGGGGSSNPTATASKLSLTLNSNSIANTGAGTVTATAVATSSSGQVVASVPVSFTVDNNATFSVSGATTDSSGTAVATINVGADRSNRVVTISAVSGSLSATAAFAVTGASLTGVPVPAIVAPGSTGNRVDFRLVDANAAPVAGQAINVTAGSLPAASGVTGTAGDFSYTYTAPTTAGSFDVTATAGGVTSTQTIQVQAAGSSNIPAAVGAIQSASVSANPSVVSVNSATTSNRIEVRALFVGANNAAIKNVRVLFDLAGDASSVGGTFSTGSSVVYSDANGIATTAYVPGTRDSPTNGVTIRACYGPTDFTSCATAPYTTTTTITIVSNPLAVSIGSNGLIYTGTSGLTYQRKYVVLVVDASGAAKANVQIVPSVDIDTYYKGQYVRPTGGGAWTSSYVDNTVTPTVAHTPVACANEDVNRNGVLESGEDLNHNGSLDPRKSDVAVSVLGSAVTDASGLATVQIEYPQNVGSWAHIKLLVSATGVSGTEGRATWNERLQVDVAALTAAGSPAFQFSPYGVADLPANNVLYADTPGGPVTSHNAVQPCNNPN